MRHFQIILVLLSLTNLSISRTSGDEPKEPKEQSLIELVDRGFWKELASRRDEVAKYVDGPNSKPAERLMLNAFVAYLDNSDIPQAVFDLQHEGLTDGRRALIARCMCAENSQFEAAKKLLLNAPKCEQSPLLQTELALFSLANRDLHDAMNHSNAAIGIDESNPDAWYCRGMSAWMLEQKEKAISDLNRAVQMQAEGPFRNESAPMMMKANFAAEQCNFEEAVRFSEAALLIDNNEPGGESHQLHLKLKYALGLQNQLGIRDPEPGVAFVLLSLANGTPQATSEIINLTSLAFKESIQFKCLKATCLAESGDFVNALKELDGATELQIATCEFLKTKASVLFEASLFDECVSTSNQCIAAFPQDPHGYYLKAMALVAKGDESGGGGCYEDAVKRCSIGPVKYEGAAWLFWANQNFVEKDYSSALRHFEKCLEMGYQQAIALQYLFVLYAAQHDLEKAYQSSIKLEQLMPGSEEALRLKTVACLRTSRPEEARTALETWASNHPTSHDEINTFVQKLESKEPLANRNQRLLK